MYAPAVSLPEPGKSEYKLAITGKEEKLVWYKFDKDLPDVGAQSSPKPVRADIVAKQEIVASPKEANKTNPDCLDTSPRNCPPQSPWNCRHLLLQLSCLPSSALWRAARTFKSRR